jgi:carbonic anhydrase
MRGGLAATIVRNAGGRVHAALNTLLVLSAVGNEGKKGIIIVVHHTGNLAHRPKAEGKENG